MAINPALVNGTSWSVAGFENGSLGTYHPVPWIFKADNTVSAKGHWSGYWANTGENRVQIFIPSGSTADIFEVYFVCSRWFVAVKNDNLYRLGKKV